MSLSVEGVQKALSALERRLAKPTTLVVGGGGALVMGHGFTLSAAELDALSSTGATLEELEAAAMEVATELEMPAEWFHVAPFSAMMPADYAKRLKKLGTFGKLEIQALSKNDLLILSCLSGKQKDRAHSLALIEDGANRETAEKHLEALKKRGVAAGQKGLDFLDELADLSEDADV